MFPTLWKKNAYLHLLFNLSSANVSDLDQFQIPILQNLSSRGNLSDSWLISNQLVNIKPWFINV